MGIEQAFVETLSQHGYHPRSDSHSNFLSEIIVGDLIQQCGLLRQRAANGTVVAKLRHHQQVNYADWVIDIAIGTCAGDPKSPPSELAVTTAEPAIIQIAIELKSIMTEHGKARKNRLRDFQAFHSYAHQYSPQTVAAAFLVVNSSQYFYSPLRKPEDITRHGSTVQAARSVAAEAIDLFRTIHLRNSATDIGGLEAIGVVAVEHDNLIIHPESHLLASLHRKTSVAPTPPSLRVGDPMHYQTMIQRICSQYSERFA